MAYSSCPTSQTLLARLMVESFMADGGCENTIKSIMSPTWLTIPMSGSKKPLSVPAPLLLVQDTIQNEENNTWFKLTNNYQEVKSDE